MADSQQDAQPEVAPGGWKVWLLAARPRTLPAAAAPVLVGAALALAAGKFQAGPALAALLAALLLQIGANLANDVFDYYRGADAVNRLGPTRATQAGWLTPQQVLRGMWLVFGLAAVLGGYLAWVAGWPVIFIGLACILAALAYTGGPLPYGYYGLGDLFVFLFFGPVATMGTYLVQTGEISPAALWASLPMGFLITDILVVNNLRDLENDRRVGKQTLAVRLGEGGTRWQYLLLLAAAYLTPVLVALTGAGSYGWLMSWLSVPLAWRWLRFVGRAQGRELNRALAGTGQLTLVYALCLGLGIIIGGW